jgi:hypothetical protein
MHEAIQQVRQVEAHRATRDGVPLFRSPALRLGLGLALLLAFATVPAGRSQNSGSNGGSNGNGGQSISRSPFSRQGGLGPASNENDLDPVMAERRIRALNMERQKLMVADTNKLFRLAKELNQEVATENTGAWTQDQLHKIAEIEKLAHNVRERMATGVGEAPSLLSSPSLIYPNH